MLSPSGRGGCDQNKQCSNVDVHKKKNITLFHVGLTYLSFLPTNVKCLTQNGHIFRVILHFLSADIQYLGDAFQLLQKLEII